MLDRKQVFEDFLRSWLAERIVALGPHVDPSDREFMAKRRASELTDLMRERGWSSELYEVVQPYRTVNEYMREMYRSAERRAANNE